MKKIYILALAALAMAFSCQKNENAPEVTSEPVVRTFTCTFAQPDTKLAIDDANGKTSWEVGDKIMIHGGTNGAARQLVTLTADDISENKKSATITVTIDPYDRTSSGVKSMFYAQYPGDLVPTGNMYYECCFNATNDKLMAACDVDGAFVFYNLCGIISYKVDDDFDQVVFSGNNDETVGYSDYYQVRIRNDKDGMITNYFKPGNGFPTNTPAKSITAPVVSDGSTVNLICIPNPSGFSGGFTMKFLKSGSIVKTLSTSSNVTLAPGQYRPMGDVTSYLKTYVPPAKHDSSIDMTGATALDASGNANCYIVDGSVAANAGKVFTFKAYKGKSSTGVGTVASTAILWETWNNAESVTKNSVIAAVDYDKQAENDYYTIVFKMPETLHPGNALIAAKNAGGDILWSWHIWVPANAFTTDTYGFGSAAMMSRNLGALVDANGTASSTPDITSVGLMYQWGRKDPFMGAGAFFEETGAHGATTYPASVFTTSASANVTLAHSIENPTEFAKGSNDSDTWSSEATVAFWGDSKTIYDPCPVGYKVPKSSEVSLLNKKSSEITGWNPCTGYNWFEAGSPASQFVNAGFIEETGLGHYRSPERVIIWSSTAYSDGIRGRCALYNGGSASSSSKQAQARGGVIRCVAE